VPGVGERSRATEERVDSEVAQTEVNGEHGRTERKKSSPKSGGNIKNEREREREREERESNKNRNRDLPEIGGFTKRKLRRRRFVLVDTSIKSGSS
jgi:hypothetical protein